MPDSPKYNFKALVREELDDFSKFLHTLEPADWEHDTLCEGWKVRHIVGHLIGGYSIPVPKVVWILAKDYQFNFPKGAHEVSTRRGATASPTELMADFDKYTKSSKHIGIATIPPMSEHFLDHRIHQWDVQIPMQRDVPLSDDRKRAALDTIAKAKGLTGLPSGAKNAKGLKLTATDMNWTHGDGPEVKGDARSLIMALGSRPWGLEGLTGDGVEILRQRIVKS